MVSKLVCHDSERWLACLYLYVGADTRGIQLKTFECLHTAPSIFKLSNYGIHTMGMGFASQSISNVY